jgi:hypothetical protein
MKALRSRILWLSLFGLAMGYFEASVVIYLRALYYPDGFSFPIRLLDFSLERDRLLFIVEIGREMASLFMMLAVAWLAERDGWRRFAAFCFLFGAWDIVYYAVLKMALGWPASLADWDILFLIPVPWLGQVWQPVLVSVSLITGALVIYFLLEKGHCIEASRSLWALEVAAGLLVIFSFTWDWFAVAVEGNLRSQPMRLALFWLGLAMGMAGLGWGVLNTLRYNVRRKETLP